MEKRGEIGKRKKRERREGGLGGGAYEEETLSSRWRFRSSS